MLPMPLRALVIDDESAVRRLLAGMLSELGYETAQAACAREGLWRLESEPFDVVFTDLWLPEMDGLCVARNVRLRWPGVRVVLLVADGEPGIGLKGAVAGLADASLVRPFARERIAATRARVMPQPAFSLRER